MDEYSAQMDKFRTDGGSKPAINVHTISFYDSPSNAPKPGLYIAADYQNTFDSGALHCGYLIWFREASGEFKIIREETGVIKKDTLDRMSEKRKEDTLKKMLCRTP